MTDKELLYKVSKTVHYDACDSILWRFDKKKNVLKIFAECSDFFEWGSADAEDITEQNVHILEESIADIAKVMENSLQKHHFGLLLFCARVRKTRPQGAYYKYLTIENVIWDEENKKTTFVQDKEKTADLRALFNQAGPPRGIDLFNPRDEDDQYLYRAQAK